MRPLFGSMIRKSPLWLRIPWGVEVRPNRTDMFDQPWHWMCIPMAGLPMGENFRLDELAKDCAEDGQYEFLFAAPPLFGHGWYGFSAESLCN